MFDGTGSAFVTNGEGALSVFVGESHRIAQSDLRALIITSTETQDLQNAQLPDRWLVVRTGLRVHRKRVAMLIADFEALVEMVSDK